MIATEQRTIGSNGHGVTGTSIVIDRSEFVVGDSGRVYRVCGRCNGNGRISHYSHVYAGECFECRTRGFDKIFDSVEAAEKNAARNAKARVKAAERREAERIVRVAERDQKFAAARERAHAEALEINATWVAPEPQSYIGQVGDKITFTGEVTRTSNWEGDYGTQYLVVVTAGSQTVKTVGTSEFHRTAEKGQTVTIKATVKEHEEYRGTKQTVVIRPKAVAG